MRSVFTFAKGLSTQLMDLIRTKRNQMNVVCLIISKSMKSGTLLFSVCKLNYKEFPNECV